MKARTVVWTPTEPGFEGHDLVRLQSSGSGFVGRGCVVAVSEDGPWSVRFTVIVDAAWRTRRVEVAALWASGSGEVVLEGDGQGSWAVDGAAAPLLDGCLDVDLGATPFTNTLPIRRLELSVGESAEVPAAWVGAPVPEVDVLHQRYTRLQTIDGLDRYRYESVFFDFSAELIVDAEGLVIDYAGLARRVASA